MDMQNITEDQVLAAIGSISESVRINGAESPVTEFLINFLQGNLSLITTEIVERAYEALEMNDAALDIG